MLLNKKIAIALAGLAMVGAAPTFAQGIGHRFFMRGSIVGKDATGPVVCIGKADGATVGQLLMVYRMESAPGPSKTPGSGFRRVLVGHVTINHIFDDHFAHVRVNDGKPTVNDIVEVN